MNITNAQAIDGWMSDDELLWLAQQAAARKRIVEIGSWKGRSTRIIADNTLGFVYAVDTWQGSHNDGNTIHRDELADKPDNWLLEEFKRNMRGLTNVRIVQMTSMQAVKVLADQRFDMIFIDASHNYESIKADILAWMPLLADGGLLCGHDYLLPNWPGVVKAVDELIPNRKLNASIWSKP